MAIIGIIVLILIGLIFAFFSAICFSVVVAFFRMGEFSKLMLSPLLALAVCVVISYLCFNAVGNHLHIDITIK